MVDEEHILSENKTNCVVEMLRGYSGLGEQSLKEIAYGILLSWDFDEKRGLWKWFINLEFFCTTVAPKVFIDDNIFSLLRVIYPLKHGQTRMDWPLSVYLKQKQGKCTRERMRELIPHLPKLPASR